MPYSITKMTWNLLKENFPDFTEKLTWLGRNPEWVDVPYFYFDSSKKWTITELLDILRWDAEYIKCPGFHAIENIYDVIESLPDKEADFYGSLLRQMEEALISHDGDSFFAAAEQWPGLINNDE